MAGILDEVMDGIAAKEKQGGQTPPTPATPPAPETPPAAGEAKPMNTYSDDFKKQYGGGNSGRKTA